MKGAAGVARQGSARTGRNGRSGVMRRGTGGLELLVRTGWLEWRCWCGMTNGRQRVGGLAGEGMGWPARQGQGHRPRHDDAGKARGGMERRAGEASNRWLVLDRHCRRGLAWRDRWERNRKALQAWLDWDRTGLACIGLDGRRGIDVEVRWRCAWTAGKERLDVEANGRVWMGMVGRIGKAS